MCQDPDGTSLHGCRCEFVELLVRKNHYECLKCCIEQLLCLGSILYCTLGWCKMQEVRFRYFFPRFKVRFHVISHDDLYTKNGFSWLLFSSTLGGSKLQTVHFRLSASHRQVFFHFISHVSGTWHIVCTVKCTYI